MKQWPVFFFLFTFGGHSTGLLRSFISPVWPAAYLRDNLAEGLAILARGGAIGQRACEGQYLKVPPLDRLYVVHAGDVSGDWALSAGDDRARTSADQRRPMTAHRHYLISSVSLTCWATWLSSPVGLFANRDVPMPIGCACGLLMCYVTHQPLAWSAVLFKCAIERTRPEESFVSLSSSSYLFKGYQKGYRSRLNWLPIKQQKRKNCNKEKLAYYV